MRIDLLVSGGASAPAHTAQTTQPVQRTTIRPFGHPMDHADRLVMRGCIIVALVLPVVLMMEGGAA